MRLVARSGGFGRQSLAHAPARPDPAAGQRGGVAGRQTARLRFSPACAIRAASGHQRLMRRSIWRSPWLSRHCIACQASRCTQWRPICASDGAGSARWRSARQRGARWCSSAASAACGWRWPANRSASLATRRPAPPAPGQSGPAGRAGPRQTARGRHHRKTRHAGAPDTGRPTEQWPRLAARTRSARIQRPPARCAALAGSDQADVHALKPRQTHPAAWREKMIELFARRSAPAQLCVSPPPR